MRAEEAALGRAEGRVRLLLTITHTYPSFAGSGSGMIPLIIFPNNSTVNLPRGALPFGGLGMIFIQAYYLAVQAVKPISSISVNSQRYKPTLTPPLCFS